MAGPSPKPTKIRALEGNPSRRPLNKREPKIVAGIQSRPEWLLPEAKREWVRVCGELESIGLLTAGDRGVLAAYCQAWARWVTLEQFITENGETQTVESKANGTYEQARPQVAMAQKWFQLMMTALSKLGISPADRSKVSVPERKGDELDALLG